MPDDVVNPVQPVHPVKPSDPPVVKWWEWVPKPKDMVAAYGADKDLKRFWIAQQGEVLKVEGEIVTVKFIPTVAADMSTCVFHKKQLRPLKQSGGRTFWVKQSDMEKVAVGDEQVFQAQITYKPQNEPAWLRAEQKTVEWEEHTS